MPEGLTKASFEPHLNEKFEVHTETAGVISLELVEVTEHKSGDIESFSVLFRGPGDKVFPHDTHKVRHSRMGEFNLFLGPVIHEKKDGIYYEAVFSRQLKKAGPTIKGKSKKKGGK